MNSQIFRLKAYLNTEEASTTAERTFQKSHNKDTAFFDGYLTALEDFKDRIQEILEEDLEEDIYDSLEEDGDDNDGEKDEEY